MEKEHKFKQFIRFADYNPWVYLILFIFIVGIPYRVYLDKKWDEAMSGPTSVSFATYSEFFPSRNGSYSIFIFNVDGKNYEVQESGEYLFLSVGDTVKIRYANKDPNYAEVIDFLYMEKFKSLRNKVNWNTADY